MPKVPPATAYLGKGRDTPLVEEGDVWKASLGAGVVLPSRRGAVTGTEVVEALLVLWMYYPQQLYPSSVEVKVMGIRLVAIVIVVVIVVVGIVVAGTAACGTVGIFAILIEQELGAGRLDAPFLKRIGLVGTPFGGNARLPRLTTNVPAIDGDGDLTPSLNGQR